MKDPRNWLQKVYRQIQPTGKPRDITIVVDFVDVDDDGREIPAPPDEPVLTTPWNDFPTRNGDRVRIRAPLSFFSDEVQAKLLEDSGPKP